MFLYNQESIMIIHSMPDTFWKTLCSKGLILELQPKTHSGAEFQFSDHHSLE